VAVSQTPFRVVIAEDEALIRLDLKEMLEEEGYVVAGEAADGEAAVELAVKLRPDLVILDVKMPVLDGISAAERIAAQHIAPVVILTAFSQRELVERARDAGAMAYLVKPFTKADLVPAIEIAASRFQETSALETEVATLKDRLEVRKILDRAKGKLQAEYGLTEPEAFRWIQKTSMDQRLAMRVVAERLIEGGMAPGSGSADGQAAAGKAAAGKEAAGKAAAGKEAAGKESAGKAAAGQTAGGQAAGGQAAGGAEPDSTAAKGGPGAPDSGPVAEASPEAKAAE
jgi:two-component system, response regulator PdtaR